MKDPGAGEASPRGAAQDPAPPRGAAQDPASPPRRAAVRAAAWASRLILLLLFTYVATATFALLATRRDLHEGISYSSAFYDRSGTKLLRLELSRDQKYRLWVPLAELSPHLVEATLVLEDRFFYWHPGVNPVALARAVWQTFVTREATVGASTITMQLARLRYGLHTRSASGKLRQIAVALALEWRYSKAELLEAYLNLAPYGGNLEGAGAASEIYFQKRARDLTAGEALLLSVLPQSPSSRAPGRTAAAEGTGGMRAARDRLLKRWLAVHPEQAAEATELLLRRTVRRPSQLPFRAPHLVDALLPSAPPGAVRTTLSLPLQDLLERQLRAYVQRRAPVGVRNASALLVDTRTMEVAALVGSVDFHDAAIKGQVDGTRAKRSPGSTLKPFIYALAMDQGLVHPRTLLKDAPTTFGEWRPENFDGDFAGPLTVHDALIRSRNVPAIQVAAQLKSPSLYEFLKAAGVAQLREERHYGLALVLGGAETTMEELVRLYAMLANGGELRPLRKLESDPVVDGKRLLSPEASELVLGILRDNPRPAQGVERKWLADRTDVAWKTGTSYSFRDAWAIGLVGPYALAVWIGNFDGESNPAFVGADMAGPLFFSVVDALKALGLPPVPIRGLPRLREVEVCDVSGKIPTAWCRHRAWTRFIPGKSPIQTCDIHRPVALDVRTGLRSCVAAGGPTRDEVFEFWDSDLLRLFRRAGIPRRLPPPWHPACAQAPKAYLGLAPRITSPRSGVTYSVRLADRDPDKLPLTAVTDADATHVYWFLDHAFLGEAPAGKPYFWKATPGDYLVQAVDDQGRSATSRLKVAVLQ